MSKSDHPSFETIDLDGIQTYLNQTEVSFAVLSGSHARGVAAESSDVDIALQFPNELSDADRFRRRNRIDADPQVYVDGFVELMDGQPSKPVRSERANFGVGESTGFEEL
ncbi:nucleotidyltransferase domain-containing protein [Natronocalculus amylovorans]|uniref:Nucleotidyltransferase domain-containing protein n=1 Tax=Natronocalculus amylovorans TaxID=2917812 RepID=A0AAE3KC94_9EURY|nr:nucleotidyltransferase domain-containing protein [Natronocalculus amylovorans]MCL9817754.1 nucleotidyltransferase domain-containing protein [Natronocalculus amylovorans]